MPRTRPAIITALTITLAAFSWATDARAQDVQSGSGEFQAWCARCHGSAGQGDGPIAKDLETAPPDLTRLSANNGGTFPAKRVKRSIDGRSAEAGHGTRLMPVWGNWFAFEVTSGGLLKSDQAKTQAEIDERISRITDHVKRLQR